MKPYDEESELQNYVWKHYRPFMTPAEREAAWAVLADDMKRDKGRDIVVEIWKEHKLAEKPDVVALLTKGAQQMRANAIKRILRERSTEVFVNRCPKCERIVRTPKALQCLWCGHDWHRGAETHQH